jgi:excisionase family DNA binding protein
MKLLLTVVEAADAVGLGKTKLYELVSSGEIVSIQIGKARRIPVHALEDWVSRQLADQLDVTPSSDPIRAAMRDRRGS